MYQQRQKNRVCNDISHLSIRKGDKNSPCTSMCEDFLASTIAISGVGCYTVWTLKKKIIIFTFLPVEWPQVRLRRFTGA